MLPLLPAAAAAARLCGSVPECLNTTLWHLPGPNPIAAPWNPNGKEAWMSTECEVAGGVQKVGSEYIFYYHCLNEGTPDNSYRVGMSTAASPLGPWTKPPTAPTLPAGKQGEWDQDTVASFNAIPDPEAPGQWLGFFEGGMGPGTDGTWSMGVARAPAPGGPWTKSKANPVLSGAKVHDPKHCFSGSSCNGLYVASVMYGPHTNHSYWVYMEAPINRNDEGPVALWTAPKPEGPYTFVRYVLDGGDKGGWDAGRCSESRVTYHDGLFHLFATCSAVGSPHPNKNVEQVGWAVSADGLHFTEYPHNPVAPQHQSTPLTSAMAEGHALIEGDRVYVYHTIRWTTDGASDFAPDARNAEDLGVEVFTSSPTFTMELPMITPHWELDLAPGAESPCKYDWKLYRYCAQLKVAMHASSGGVLRPAISFRVAAECDAGDAHATVSADVRVYAFSNDASVGKLLRTLPLSGACSGGAYTGTTAAVSAADLPGTDWVVATVANARGSAPLRDVTQAAVYAGDGVIHAA